MANESDKPFLPFEIIIHILQRLPIKSIVRFQCVCKDWKNLFTIPSFRAEQVLHSAHENPFLLIHEYDYKYRRSFLRLLNQKMETAEVLSTHSIDSFRRGWRITGSCNGLLCVELNEQGRFPISYLLWNPVMNKVIEVPQTLNDFSSLSMVGFGYSNVVNDFKIVRFYHSEMLKKKEDQNFSSGSLNRAQMFSLSTGSWKELEFGALHLEFFHDAVCANGNIFWIGWVFDPVIVCFHIATEVFTFTTIETLPSSVDVADDCLGPLRPYVHGNKLAMCDGIESMDGDSETYSIHMRVVEEGDSESGNSLICTEKYKIGPLATVLIPCCIWRNQIVCIYVEGEAEGKGKDKGEPTDFLYLFNLTTKEWTKFPNFAAAYDRCAIFNYERSHVSVCNI